MKIEVITNNDDTTKERGDLLEKITQELLKLQNYETTPEMRKTGVELDVVCKSNVNSKKIFVECKAYRDKKIESEILYKMIGIKNSKKYDEAWLITTSELGKEAQGVIDELDEIEKKIYNFYTPNKIIEALTNAKLIQNEGTVINEVLKIIGDKHKLGDTYFFITKLGYFWAIEYKNSGQPQGVILLHADDSRIVDDKELLTKIKEMDSSIKELDFLVIKNYLKNKSEKIFDISIKDIKLNRKYLKQINNMDIKLSPINKDELFLDEIFVFPDLKNINDDNEPDINSKKIIELSADNKRLVILGDDTSGKSSLAFMIQKELNKEELIPIYINAEEIKVSNSSSFEERLKNNFKNQYNKELSYIEAFNKALKENKDKIIIIIDDFDLIKIKKSSSKIEFLKILSENFSNIFIFINSSMEIEINLENDLKRSFTDFKTLKIKQLGHLLRSELIDKWINIEYGEIIKDEDFISTKDDISDKIETLIGKKFLPTYPIQLLSMLQIIRSGVKNNLRGSAYAEIYRLLISNALVAVNVNFDDFDFYYAYLSFVAYQLFKEQKKGFTEEEIINFYNFYSNKIGIQKDIKNILSMLLKAKILKYNNELYSFSFSYFYYFFIAKYLSDNIDDASVNNDIKTISEKIYRSEYANIIIFLIYHSKDRSIIDGIIKESAKLFGDILPSTLSIEELSKYKLLIQEEVKFYIEDGKDPYTYRKEKLKNEDDANKEDSEAEAQENENEEIENFNLFKKINLSFKLMEILGQISINHYTLDKNRKVDIIDEVSSLGLRSLHSLLNKFDEYIDTIKEEVKSEIDKKNIEIKQDKEQVVDRLISEFTEMLVAVFIKKISDSMSSKTLFLISKELVNKKNTISIKLIDIAIKLNFQNEIDIKEIMGLDKEFENNYLAKRMLRFLVVEHLYKFYVPFDKKQGICDQLGINMKKNQLLLGRK